jgi:hypothetical protein
VGVWDGTVISVDGLRVRGSVLVLVFFFGTSKKKRHFFCTALSKQTNPAFVLFLETKPQQQDVDTQDTVGIFVEGVTSPCARAFGQR